MIVAAGPTAVPAPPALLLSAGKEVEAGKQDDATTEQAASTASVPASVPAPAPTESVIDLGGQHLLIAEVVEGRNIKVSKKSSVFCSVQFKKQQQKTTVKKADSSLRWEERFVLTLKPSHVQTQTGCLHVEIIEKPKSHLLQKVQNEVLGQVEVQLATVLHSSGQVVRSFFNLEPPGAKHTKQVQGELLLMVKYVNIPKQAAVDPTVPADSQLPKGWVQLVDSADRPYYQNAELGITQWEKPSSK